MDTVKFWAACLASYNNGELHGAWIDATNDADEMQAQVDAMLRRSKFPNIVRKDEDGVEYATAEEWCIHDYDDADKIISGLGETSDLKAIASRIEAAELAEDALGTVGPEIVAAYWGNVGNQPDDAHDAVQQASDAYQGEFDTWEDFAYEHIQNCGLLDGVPEFLQNYFDYAAYGRDLKCDYFREGKYFFQNI